MGLEYNSFTSPFKPNFQGSLSAQKDTRVVSCTRQSIDAVSQPRTIHNLMRLSSNGSSSSGSEREPDSVCLAEMVNEFLEDGFVESNEKKINYGSAANCSYRVRDSKREFNVQSPIKSLKVLVESCDLTERKLLQDVSSIVESFTETTVSTLFSAADNCSGSCLRRFVMSQLRSLGYNAAVCKSRWPHTRNSPGGEYEYIDVLTEGTSRLIVDIDFSGQFQITRPTSQYASILEIVPPIFIGRASRLLQIVDLMTEEAKASLKSRDMHLPPWRKLEYMRLKWLSQYKRTTNESPKKDACQCKNSDVIINQIGNKGTATSPILLEIQALNNDPLHYGGKVFCLKENCLRGNRTACECNANEKSLKEMKAAGLDNLQWKLPSVAPTTGVKAGLSTCFKQSELAKQLKGVNTIGRAVM